MTCSSGLLSPRHDPRRRDEPQGPTRVRHPRQDRSGDRPHRDRGQIPSGRPLLSTRTTRDFDTICCVWRTICGAPSQDGETGRSRRDLPTSTRAGSVPGRGATNCRRRTARAGRRRRTSSAGRSSARRGSRGARRGGRGSRTRPDLRGRCTALRPPGPATR